MRNNFKIHWSKQNSIQIKKVPIVLSLYMFLLPLLCLIFFIFNGTEYKIFENYKLDFVNVFFVIVFYSISHLMRLFRFALIATPLINLRFREIIMFYLNSALMLLIAPFKSGEIYRIILLTNISKDFLGSLLVTLIEKSADAFVILIIFYFFIFNTEVDSFYIVITLLLTSIVILFIFTLWVLGPILITAQNYIFEIHNSSLSLMFLKILFNINYSINKIKRTLKGKILSIVSFSIMVYFFEALTIYFALNDSYLNIFEQLKTNITYSVIPYNGMNEIQSNILLNWFFILTFYWFISLFFIYSINKNTKKNKEIFYEE